jgi:hypothetical protein
MELQEGDRVWVNIAPFIGSIMRANQSISCEVLAVSGLQVRVRTMPPCRCVSLWVLSSWIEGYADEELSGSSAAAVAH